jgi:hypothetical protein
MEQVTLLSIDSDGSDVYVSRCLLDGKEVRYRFNYVSGANSTFLLDCFAYR